MVRALLVDRFKLKWHVEQREQSVLELVTVTPGRVGPRLASRVDTPKCEQGAVAADAPRLDSIPCGSPGLVFAISPEKGSISGRSEPMARLAALLSYNGAAGVDRAVINRTGLLGNFDFTVGMGLSTPRCRTSVASRKR